MGESILKLQQIRKSFDHTEVLKGVDLEVAQGEFITLLGASGCGKTTTLRIIAGLELPDSGSVILEGRDITDWEPNKRDVNTVFQNYALFPHMNVADNVGYGLKIRKVPKAEIAGAVGISEGHLSHCFKKETGYTVMGWLTRYRMKKAVELLLDHRNKVYEVAEKVGYKDIAYFSNTFKKIAGVAPSEIQEK